MPIDESPKHWSLIFGSQLNGRYLYLGTDGKFVHINDYIKIHPSAPLESLKLLESEYQKIKKSIKDKKKLLNISQNFFKKEKDRWKKISAVLISVDTFVKYAALCIFVFSLFLGFDSIVMAFLKRMVSGFTIIEKFENCISNAKAEKIREITIDN